MVHAGSLCTRELRCDGTDVLIFIRNTPRSYAWGSQDGLSLALGTTPTGEPEAELWLGDHPGHPASVAKATPVNRTLIDLIERDPAQYGVDGGKLPFLLKVLAIGAPLSLQVHPNIEQAAAGFAAEEATGVPLDARERNYGDSCHKPELLVALSEVTALCGFRSVSRAQRDLRRIADAAPEGPLQEALLHAANRLRNGAPEASRREFLEWAFSGEGDAGEAILAISLYSEGLGKRRAAALRSLSAAHPGDPGVLVSLLLNLVTLMPGEAVFLRARQLHAYLGGIAVEVMASSDNVLRAGLTSKHVDIPEVTRILDTSELTDPKFESEEPMRGLSVWQPDIPDFRLLRARLHEAHEEFALADAASSVTVPAPYPLVLIATAGRVRVERTGAELSEVASVRKGQSLYISAGDPVELTGRGEVFLATVGENWDRSNRSVSD